MMTTILGPAAFAAARQSDRAEAAAERALARSAARQRLDRARTTFAGGDLPAEDEADRLEDLAQRLVAFVDLIEPSFEGLQLARDLPGAPIRRSRWRRSDVAVSLAEGFDGLLAPEALALLVASVAAEAGP